MEVSYLYKTAGKMMVVGILVFQKEGHRVKGSEMCGSKHFVRLL
jgi:hypothetical protein